MRTCLGFHFLSLPFVSRNCVAGAAAEGAAVEDEVWGAPGPGAAASGGQTGAAEPAEGQPRAGRCEAHSWLSSYRGTLPRQHRFKSSGRGATYIVWSWIFENKEAKNMQVSVYFVVYGISRASLVRPLNWRTLTNKCNVGPLRRNTSASYPTQKQSSTHLKSQQNS